MCGAPSASYERGLPAKRRAAGVHKQERIVDLTCCLVAALAASLVALAQSVGGLGLQMPFAVSQRKKKKKKKREKEKGKKEKKILLSPLNLPGETTRFTTPPTTPKQATTASKGPTSVFLSPKKKGKKKVNPPPPFFFCTLDNDFLSLPDSMFDVFLRGPKHPVSSLPF